MSNRSGLLSVWALVVGILTASAPALADSLTLITSKAAQFANDAIDWSQLGADATSLAASFPANSTHSLGVTGALTGAGSLTAVVCPATPCSWGGASSGFVAGDELIWTSDTGNSGNGPLSLTFASMIAGGGAFVQSDGPAQFTAQLEAFNGSTSLGFVTETSDGSGDPIYLGLQDTTGTNISALVFSITTCDGDCTDFAVDAVQLNNPAAPTNTVLKYKPHQLTYAAEAFADHTGLRSQPLKVKIINPTQAATVAVVIESPVIDDRNHDFSIDSGTTTCSAGLLLNPGSHCFVGLVFQPTGVGPRPGTLEIHSNAQNNPQMVSLSGIGKPPRLVVLPSQIGFGTVPLNTTSPAHDVTLTNNSPVPIALGTPTSPGNGFAIIGSTCGASLANTPGSNSCTISLTFTPTAKPGVSAILQINDDAKHNPQKVKLTGSGK